MPNFTLRENGYIYLIHWIDSGNPLRLSTKLKIESKEWNSAKSKPKNPVATYNGKCIVNELNKYENCLTKALINHPLASVPELKTIIKSYIYPEQSEKSTKISLSRYFEQYIDEVKARKQSNWKHYAACLGHLKTYSQGKAVQFSSVDMKFYKGFNQHLIDKALSMNTIANQFKLLKSVMQSGYMDGLHKNESFRHFKRPMEQSDTIYLSEQELENMYNLKLSGHLEKARDYFIIGAFTGLRFEDWNRVSSDAVKDGIMHIRSSKTDDISLIPVHPYVHSILSKYNGSLPQKPSNQKLNEFIKIVALRAGIEEPVEYRITRGGEKETTLKAKYELVTTHTARRSLATNLILRGVSPFVVMKVTGHRSMSSFERYVRLQELQASIQLKELDFFKDTPRSDRRLKASELHSYMN